MMQRKLPLVATLRKIFRMLLITEQLTYSIYSSLLCVDLMVGFIMLASVVWR